MVNELFFETSIKDANASIIDLVKKQITDISTEKEKEEKLKLIEAIYKKISETNSEIRNRTLLLTK